MVNIAIAPTIWRSTTNVGDGPLVAVLQVRGAPPRLRWHLWTPADLGCPVEVRLLDICWRTGTKVLPESLVEFPQPPLPCSCWDFKHFCLSIGVLMVLACAQTTLHTSLLLCALALEIAHEVDFQVLRAQLATHGFPDLGKGQLVKVLNTWLRDAAIVVHDAHETVHGALLQRLLHRIGLGLVSLLCTHESRELPSWLLEEQVQQLQHCYEAIVGHREIGIDVREFQVEIQVHTHEIGDGEKFDLLAGESADCSRFGDGPNADHRCTQLVRSVRRSTTRHEEAH
mmetsp:Transcript_41428/g.131182  ORF Transcript_41428/g.131182 Transcript_41428/m.131182 type:complete len:284 (+) Transcript_41428:797-1648(+)